MNEETAGQEPTEIDELTAMKAVAVNMATIEVLRLHRDEILNRAIELLAEKGITVTESELAPPVE